MNVADNPRLGPRHEQVRQLLLEGRELVDIFRELGLSIHTLRGYIKEIFRAEGVHSRHELMGREIVRLREIVAAGASDRKDGDRREPAEATTAPADATPAATPTRLPLYAWKPSAAAAMSRIADGYDGPFDNPDGDAFPDDDPATATTEASS